MLNYYHFTVPIFMLQKWVGLSRTHCGYVLFCDVTRPLEKVVWDRTGSPSGPC